MSRRKNKNLARQHNGPPQQQQPQQQILAQNWQGPIPPPGALEHVDRIVPGGADRLIRMAEQQQAHRIAMEASLIQSNIVDTSRGQIFGVVVALVAVVGAIYLAATGAPWQVPVALVSVPILGVVKALIDGRRGAQHDDQSGK